MPRAKRYYIPGYAWHITHRCHKREFLLKLVKDRQLLIYWIFQAKKRYNIINIDCMMKLLQFQIPESLREAHYNWVEEKLKSNSNIRDSKWTESIGVGNESFLKSIKDKLGYRAKNRNILKTEEPNSCQLREPQAIYETPFSGGLTEFDNQILWSE